MARDIEDATLGIGELDLEVLPLGVPEREGVLAALLLDAALRGLEVVDDETEMLAHGLFRADEREVHHAVGEVDRRADFLVLDVRTRHPEDFLVEARRLLEVLHADPMCLNLAMGASFT